MKITTGAYLLHFHHRGHVFVILTELRKVDFVVPNAYILNGGHRNFMERKHYNIVMYRYANEKMYSHRTFIIFIMHRL